MDAQKINTINSLQFIDWSCSGVECEYVLVARSQKNINALVKAGFELKTIHSNCQENSIDVSALAWESGADWFNPKLQSFGEHGDSRLHAESEDE